MEVLASRVLLRPRDFAASVDFYGRVLGLHVYRDFGAGVVFFLGGGYLEVSRRSAEPAGDKLELWMQVRDVDAVHADLAARGVAIVAPPAAQPWGLREMRIRDPDGVGIYVVQVPDDHPLRRRPPGPT
jgi:catechol 2,3-dioxygenase-like lactoylglutathione lyase family enzyme